MPIKKENLARYPSNWKQISLSVRKDANNCCEFCSIPNYAVGYRNAQREFISHQRHSLRHASHKAASATKAALEENASVKYIIIVLTVAHLDHAPENCGRENLKALCQMCHLLYDAEHHANTRRAAKKSNNMELDYV